MKPVRPELDAVPQSSVEACKTLAADIDEVGQVNDILLYEGAIIDGRTRERAILEFCKSGIEPRYANYEGDLPAYRLAFSLNLRRDLSTAQRIDMVLSKWDKYKADAKDRQRSAGGSASGTGSLSASQTAAQAAAEDAGVSDRTIKDAVLVKEHGSKRLQRDVRSGKVSTKAAAKQVRESQPPKVLTRDQMLAKMPTDVKDRVLNLHPGNAEIARLSEFKPDQQKAIVALVDGKTVTSIGAAIGEFDKDGAAPRDKLKQVIPPKLRKHADDGWFATTEKALKQAITDLKVRSGNPFLHPLEPIVEHLQAAATKIGDAAFGIVCPACDGAGKDCGWCRSTGWMPAWAFTDYKAKTNYKGKK